MRAKIFNGIGFYQAKYAPGDYKCITVKVGGSQTYFAKAPILGISVSQQVDFSLSKTMAGNFNLVTFQDQPVVINISGMINMTNACGGSSASSIAQLYKTAKASKNSQMVTINIGGAVYKGLITAFSQQASQSFPGLFTYSLSLFGVRV